MLSVIFTVLSYGFLGILLIAYIIFSFHVLEEWRSGNKIYILNLILICLIIILFIFVLAWLGRFDNLDSASDLLNNISWVVVEDFGIAFKYAWLGATAPTIAILILIISIAYLCHAFISSFITDVKIETKTKDLASDVNQLRERRGSHEQELRRANKARSDAISLLADKDKELSKKSLELAQISQKNNKYIQFYNENSNKIVNSKKVLQSKDSKITELEEIIKRRDLQIQRLKKSRKDS